MKEVIQVEKRIREIQNISVDRLMNESKDYIRQLQEEVNNLKMKRKALIQQGKR